MQTKRRNYTSRRKPDVTDERFNIKLFIAMTLLLMVLLMQKYDIHIGQIDVDDIYAIVYRSENFDKLSSMVFKLQENDETTDEPQ